MAPPSQSPVAVTLRALDDIRLIALGMASMAEQAVPPGPSLAAIVAAVARVPHVTANDGAAAAQSSDAGGSTAPPALPILHTGHPCTRLDVREGANVFVGGGEEPALPGVQLAR